MFFLQLNQAQVVVVVAAAAVVVAAAAAVWVQHPWDLVVCLLEECQN